MPKGDINFASFEIIGVKICYLGTLTVRHLQRSEDVADENNAAKVGDENKVTNIKLNPDGHRKY